MRRRAAALGILLALCLGGGTVLLLSTDGPDARGDPARSAAVGTTDPREGSADVTAPGPGGAGAAVAPAIASEPGGIAGETPADPAPAPVAAEPGLDPAYAIRGTVVDADGREVGGAEVELYRHVADPDLGGAFEDLLHGLDRLAGETPLASARTDLAGRFALIAGAPGEYRVVARALRLAGAVEGPFRLGERDPAVDLLIVLGGGLSISGFVADESGRPVGGAEVALLDQLEGELPGSHYHALRTASAADGSFAFDGVEPRRYILVAVADGYARALVPSVTPPLDGLRVEVGRGRELVVRVLRAEAPAEPGTLFLPEDGTPVAGAEVYAVNPVGFAVATSDAEGIARLVIGGRDASLRIVADGFRTAQVRSVEIPADPQGSPHDVVLEPLEAFEGVVVRSDGEPAAGAEIIEHGGGILGGGLRVTRADEAGRFVAASSSIIAALGGEVSALGGTGSPTIALEPTLTVRGRVIASDLRPAVGARVRLTGSTGENAATMESLLRAVGAQTVATVGLDGAFLLAGVPAWGMEIVLRIEFDGAPDRIELIAEDLGEIVLGEEAVLEGRIVTPEGRAPAAAALVLELPGSAPVRRDPATGALRGGVRVLVAADGSFRIGRLRPSARNPLELHVVAPPYLEEARRIPLEPGPNGPVEIRLRAGGEALVRVVEGTGAPSAAARVELTPVEVGATRRARTGPDGVARFAGIAAGNYMVQAISGAATGGALVEVTAGEVAEIELTID